AAGEQGHRLGGPAVVARRRQAGVDGVGGGADEVAARAVHQAGQTAAVADQVVIAWVGGPEEVRSGGRGVGGDDRVVQGQADLGGAVNAAAEVGRRVAGDGAVVHHHSAGVGDGAAGAGVGVTGERVAGRVAAEGAAGHRQPAMVEDPAAIA